MMSSSTEQEMADAEGLVRIENDAQLDILRAHHRLVDIPESAALQLNPELPDNRRCAPAWTVKFATDMAGACTPASIGMAAD